MARGWRLAACLAGALALVSIAAALYDDVGDGGSAVPPDAAAAELDGTGEGVGRGGGPSRSGEVPHHGPTTLDDGAPDLDPAPAGRFAEDFDNTEGGAPTRWNPPNWDVAVHSRDVATWEQLEPVDAHHGDHDCGSYPGTHATTAYEDAVFTCADDVSDHVMTSISASGYGAIYLTPDHMVDFSGGEAVVSVDVSLLRTSQRDWIDIWITPYDENVQAPLENWFPDLAGPPAHAVQVKMENADRGTTFEVNVYRDHRMSTTPGDTSTAYETFLEPSAVRRDTLELRISRTHLTLGLPGHGVTYVDAEVPDLGWDTGVVQLGHHSYNPSKDDAGGVANTWHWDNVVIEPAVPFTMIEADRRMVTDLDEDRTVTFAAAAPPDAHLRFSGAGQDIEVSFDGGETWQLAERPPQDGTRNGLLFSNYWTPVPAETQQVVFRGDPGWVGRWNAKDFAIWSPLVGSTGSTALSTERRSGS